MILADVFKYVFLVLGTLVVIVSYWLVATALLPDVVERARMAYGAKPVRLTLRGSLVAAPLLLLGAALMNAAPSAGLKVLGGTLAALPVLGGLIGSAGLAERVGHGLAHADDLRSPWRRSLRGGAVLSLTFLLPVVGWFAILPWVLVSGLGAVLVAWKRPAAAVHVELTRAA